MNKNPIESVKRNVETVVGKVEDQAEKFEIWAGSIFAGNGHFKIGLGLERLLNQTTTDLKTKASDLGEFIGKFATHEELDILKKLDRRNRVLLTVILAAVLPSIGYVLLSKILRKLPATEIPLTWDLEQKLAVVFAKAVQESGIKMVIAAHPTIARIALAAKKLGLLPDDFEVIVLATDELAKAPPVVQQIYYLVFALDGHNNYVIVGDDATVQKFIEAGHPAEMILIADPEYLLTDIQQEIIRKKQEKLKALGETGLSSQMPLIVPFLDDNFETAPRRKTTLNLVNSYAPELIERKMIFFFFVTTNDEEKLRRKIAKLQIPETKVKTLDTYDQLKSFFTADDDTETSIVFVRKHAHKFAGKNPQEVTHEEHVDFTDKQEWLLLNADIAICPTNEMARYAAMFGVPTCLTMYFGPVEQDIDTLNNKKLHISIPWASVDRSLSSAIQCRLRGVARHDLAQPETFQLLLEMREQALKSPVREPLQGIVKNIKTLIAKRPKKTD